MAAFLNRCRAMLLGVYLRGFGGARLRHFFLHAGEDGFVGLFLGFVVGHTRMMSYGQKQNSSFQHRRAGRQWGACFY